MKSLYSPVAFVDLAVLYVIYLAAVERVRLTLKVFLVVIRNQALF